MEDNKLNSEDINDLTPERNSGECKTPDSVDEQWAERLGLPPIPPYSAVSDSTGPESQMVPPVIPPAPTMPPQNAQDTQNTQGVQNTQNTKDVYPQRVMPPTYMVWSILATVCCCIAGGVVAIFYSASVSSKFYARDYEGAEKASERAQLWIIIAIVAGVVSNALMMPFSLLTN
ncbi:MAG: CD225/dispanin family protein [Candidatus Amulumruptor caecigallinarius]|nr:CD225/dispanin family protein [Candidatus Amulumruptor caecigallinarius]